MFLLVTDDAPHRLIKKMNWIGSGSLGSSLVLLLFSFAVFPNAFKKPCKARAFESEYSLTHADLPALLLSPPFFCPFSFSGRGAATGDKAERRP